MLLRRLRRKRVSKDVYICVKNHYLFIVLLHTHTHTYTIYFVRLVTNFGLGATMPCERARWLRRQCRETAALFTSARGWISIKARTHNGTSWSMGYGQSSLFSRGWNNGFKTSRRSILHHPLRTKWMARAQFEYLPAIEWENLRCPVRDSTYILYLNYLKSRILFENPLGFRNIALKIKHSLPRNVT